MYFYDPLAGMYCSDLYGVLDDPIYDRYYAHLVPVSRSEYERGMPPGYETYADGAPLPPPTVCHSGCNAVSHRIPAGGLPQGASLGKCHKIAAEERICLTHVWGGCFDDGICERLNTRITKETLGNLGYYAADMTPRQWLRVAAGLPAGPANGPPPTQTHTTPREPDTRPGRIEQGGRDRDHHSAGSGGRGHHGAQERHHHGAPERHHRRLHGSEESEDDEYESYPEPGAARRGHHGPQQRRRQRHHESESSEDDEEELYREPGAARYGTNRHGNGMDTSRNMDRSSNRPLALPAITEGTSSSHRNGNSGSQSRAMVHNPHRGSSSSSGLANQMGSLSLQGSSTRQRTSGQRTSTAVSSSSRLTHGHGGERSTRDGGRHGTDGGYGPGSSRSATQGSMAGTSREHGRSNGGREMVPRGYDFEGQGRRR
ncbi:MAG: hypothetical protein Q9226_003126 [Calogaya cf. arnoldii]